MNQKWNLQDIRPAEPRKRRTLSDQRLPTSPIRPITEPVRDEPLMEKEQIPSIRIENGTKRGHKRIIFAGILGVFLIAGALVLSALLGKTELTINPKTSQPNISSEFTVYPDKRENALSYELMTLESTSESQVKASGQIDVKEKATGKIEIIKTTPGAEQIVANTRFRSPDGKIFRIKDAILVPGSVNNVPGTIQADVVADDVGDSYNLAASTRFDVPGFQEGGLDDLYKSIYAENRTAFTGGIEGPQYKIDAAELGTARQALQIKLRDELLNRVESEKPNGFVVFPGAVAITYNQLPAVEYGDNLVTIKEQAIVQIPIFKQQEIGSFLAKEAVATYNGGEVRIDNPSDLKFAYTSATTSNSVIANEPSLTFKLTGKPLLVWEYDAKKLTKDLAGLPKTAINNAISSYTGIEGAKVSVTPFWKRSFPENSEDIIVIEEIRKPE